MHGTRTFLARLGSILLALLTAQAASAHLLPAQTATMHIVGTSAYLAVSVPVSALANVDANGDGRLSNAEITRENPAIVKQFQGRFHLTSDGDPGRTLLTWVMSPETAGQDDAGLSYVVVLQREQFRTPPQHPVLLTDLFGSGPGEGQMTLHASSGTRAEVAILDTATPSHRFFGSGWDTFTDFVRIGIGHILGGPDHLLFLLTIIVAGAGWRYWLTMVTSFTIAHSITLSLAVFGVVTVSPAIVEPAIAASIVVMAALNLARGETLVRARVGIVFACGLLHGLGFASALSAMGLDASHRIASLLGFNVGVEIGQFLFLGAVLGGAALLRRLWPRVAHLPAQQLASVAAAVLGGAMLVSRVLPILPGV